MEELKVEDLMEEVEGSQMHKESKLPSSEIHMDSAYFSEDAQPILRENSENEVKIHEGIIEEAHEITHKNQKIDDSDICEEPLPVPQPIVSPKRFDMFLESLRLRLSSPKRKPKNPAQSKLYSFLDIKTPEKFKSLHEFVQKIGVKQIAQLKYYKELPSIAEDIALCYLYLFNMPIPKNHFWEKFLTFLAQPGLVIQKFRQLPEVLDSNSFDPCIIGKVCDIMQNIPKSQLKLENCYFELQTLVNLLKEIMDIVEVPVLLPKSQSLAHIPTSRLPQSERLNISGMQSKEISKSSDNDILKAAISKEHQIVKSLHSELSKRKWDEKRYLKQENQKEQFREQVREIEIQKNTDVEFKNKMEYNEKTQKKMQKIYGDLQYKESKIIKRNAQKNEVKQMKRDIQDNFESMKWDQQWEKAKVMKYKSEQHEVFNNHVLDRRDYKLLEDITEKREVERTRNEEANMILKLRYKELIQEKEILQKALAVYNN